MIRRLHARSLFIGDVPLDPAQARHARDVLRLESGAIVEIFDDAGATASGTLLLADPKHALVRVERIESAGAPPACRLTIASAVPKGERADWMVEKLSELGVHAFVPLATDRSVVKPEGKNKYERWNRIATESAKQSRRAGVMSVETLQSVAVAVRKADRALHLSTDPAAVPLIELLGECHEANDLTLLIGPEGGWTDEETRGFESTGVQGVKLTNTVLRVETAAVAAAAIVMAFAAQSGGGEIGPRMDANTRE